MLDLGGIEEGEGDDDRADDGNKVYEEAEGEALVGSEGRFGPDDCGAECV